MFTIAIHIVAIPLLIAFFYPIAHRRGFTAGQRRLRRELGMEPESSQDAEKKPLD